MHPSTLQIDGHRRWCIYRRLQELGIDCSCQSYRPLCVNVSNYTVLWQVWSVTRQYQSSRAQQIGWLETCWQQAEC